MSRPPKHPPKPKEPLVLWWMPVVALVAPAVYAAWRAVSEGADDAAFALLWPGVALYFGSLVVLWAGWKLELE